MNRSFAHGSLVALFALFALACSPARRDDDGESCARPCRTACCAVGEICHPDRLTCEVCTAKTCAAAGAECGSVDDGCGESLACGSCPAPLTCGGGGLANKCGAGVCVKATCASLGAQCGRVGDGCGGVLDCGSCTGALTCGVPSANKCGTGTCVAENDLSMCARFGKDCGTVVEFDNCGNSRVIPSCGVCSGPSVCGGNSVCRCDAESDEALCEAVSRCGPQTLHDRCGATRQIECEACPSYSHACATHADCSGDARCFRLAANAQICTRDCSSGNPCQEGGTCVEALHRCARPCTTAAQCETDQLCFEGGCFPSALF